MVLPSCCGMFVCRLVTSIDTRIEFPTTFVVSMTSVISLRYNFCDLAIGWRRLSTNDEILSGGFAAWYYRSPNLGWFVNLCEIAVFVVGLVCGGSHRFVISFKVSSLFLRFLLPSVFLRVCSFLNHQIVFIFQAGALWYPRCGSAVDKKLLFLPSAIRPN